MDQSGGKVIGKCPACGAEVHETKKGWFCRNAACQFAFWKDNRFFQAIGKELDARTAEKLVTMGKAYLPNCRSRKTGKKKRSRIRTDRNDRPGAAGQCDENSVACILESQRCGAKVPSA